MAEQTAADILVESLIDWGVDTVFGIPGDGINGIIEALRKRQDDIRFIQTRHEESAALAACGHAKWTGRLGVCIATSGPGGLHLLNGLYDAKLDHQPVLTITGLPFHDMLHTQNQQDIELDKVFMDVAVYNNRVMGPSHVENTVDLACRTALAYRGVAHITMPVDVQSMSVDPKQRSERNVPGRASDLMAKSARLPDEDQLARAATILNAGRKTVILAGQGALGAGDKLIALAERLAAPIVKPLLGKATVPDDSPYTTGGIGLLGTRPSQEALEDCDTLLIAGSSFPYIEYYPKPDRARAVQVDLDPQCIGLRFPVEAGLVGDTGKVIDALLPRLDYREDRSFLDKAQAGMDEWNALMVERGTRDDKPMKPQVVAYELNKLLTDDAIVATDSGTITTWAARYLDMRGSRKFSCSGNLATMACGLPYAIAAAIAYPSRQVVCFIGDGGVSMLIGDLATCIKYDLDIKIVVIKNNTLGQIKWEQMVFLGNPEYVCDLQPIDFVTVARGFGVRAYGIDDPADCGGILREAFATRGPALIEATVDPHEPPMPPKATLKQATKFAQSLAKGSPAREKIALTVASDVVREIV
ncbi:thiamine pyrophosphate-dependent enzyme [Devosia nitrariae]|uniref:Pyruvate oxidase n=1 Tax=Devosia nitrariae TaxID=2071872 RepID=A0ABQ5WBL6_9HYPH|nr:thiamine pyrophosphate-dependent enzyme [Devosia nitrariae]GLQ57113.1 pyruvate oxidase [Devosia nitrariae]